MGVKPITKITQDVYNERLKKLIAFRNTQVSRRTRRYSESEKLVFDRNRPPFVDDFKTAVKSSKGNIQDIANFFMVPKNVVIYWLQLRNDFKDVYLSYIIDSQSSSLFITVEEMTSSIEWKMCVFETDMSPLDIKSNYFLTKNMAPIFKFKSYLYAFPFLRKYGNAKDIRRIRDRIFTLYLQSKSSDKMRNIILEFEKISGLSFQFDVVK